MDRPRMGSSLQQPDLSPAQREWLGIGPDEAVRVLQSGSQLVLLERAGCSRTALPWDRDLVLTADVRAFPLADLLHLLHASAKSGFVHFEDARHAKSVYLHRGEVVFATSNQSYDRLGETLLRVGVITPEQFREARRAYSPQHRFGRVLVERGYLSPRQLWNAVKLQVEEIVRSLFSYGSGNVHFWEGEVRPDNVVRLSLPTRRLIAEGLRRRDELLKFVAWLESPRVRIERESAEGLAGTERAVFEAVDGSAGFEEVCARAGVDPLTGARTIQLLRLVGAVRTERGGGDEPGAGGAADSGYDDEAALRECIGAYVKLIGELAAPIVAVEGAQAIRERIEPVVAEAARRYPELLSGLPIGAGAALDPEELVARALRFPGEREREVRLALGEIVSYLEFDLLNHPRVSDPEQFLDGVERLRASL